MIVLFMYQDGISAIELIEDEDVKQQFMEALEEHESMANYVLR